MTKVLCAAAFMIAMTLAALAAGEEYFVAMDTSMNQCRLMSTPPDGTTMKKVGDSSYATLDDAQKALETMPECKG
jgi:hypothetical protein